jgi:hypothetical protein
VYVICGEIRLVLEDECVLPGDVVLVEVWSHPDPVDAVDEAQIEEDLRVTANDDQLPIRMVVLDTLGDCGRRDVLAKAAFNVE